MGIGNEANAAVSVGLTDLKITSALSIPDNVETILPWHAAVSDNLGAWNVADPTKIIVPDRVDYLRLYAHVEWYQTPGGYRYIRLMVNGIAATFPYTSGKDVLVPNGVISDHQSALVPLMKCTPGDALTIAVKQTAGMGSSIVSTSAVRFMVEWIKTNSW